MSEIYIIGGDHHNTLGVIRALGFRGIKPCVIIVTDKKNPYVGYSRFVKEKWTVETDEEAIALLMNRKGDTTKDVVIACSDSASSAIDINRDVLSAHYFLPGSEKRGRITEIMDKSRMSEEAERIGLRIPYSWVVEKGDVVDNIDFPCITKPILSKAGHKSDIAICYNKDELLTAISNGSCNKYQVQRFIDKDFEYQLIGLSLNNGEDIIIPGFSRCIRPCPGTNTGFLHYEALDGLNAPVDKCQSFIKSVGYSGLFSMEFLRGKDGVDYFMEMNFRNDGNAICVTKAGFNLPYLWYMACTGMDYEHEMKSFSLKPVFIMPEFDDFRFFVLKRKISVKAWISDVRRTDGFMEYDKQDKLPFYAGIKDMFWQKAKRLLRK